MLIFSYLLHDRALSHIPSLYLESEIGRLFPTCLFNLLARSNGSEWISKWRCPIGGMVRNPYHLDIGSDPKFFPGSFWGMYERGMTWGMKIYLHLRLCAGSNWTTSHNVAFPDPPAIGFGGLLHHFAAKCIYLGVLGLYWWVQHDSFGLCSVTWALQLMLLCCFSMRIDHSVIGK